MNDDGLKHLYGMIGLKNSMSPKPAFSQTGVSESGVSESGVRELKAELPNCKILSDDPDDAAK